MLLEMSTHPVNPPCCCPRVGAFGTGEAHAGSGVLGIRQSFLREEIGQKETLPASLQYMLSSTCKELVWCHAACWLAPLMPLRRALQGSAHRNWYEAIPTSRQLVVRDSGRCWRSSVKHGDVVDGEGCQSRCCQCGEARPTQRKARSQQNVLHSSRT